MGLTPLPRAVVVLLLPILGLQVWNAFNGAPWPYLLGVFAILINAFFTFLALLFRKTDPEAE